MSENYNYGYGRYRDEYGDEHEEADGEYQAGYNDLDDDAEYLDAYRQENDEEIWTAEDFRNYERSLAEAVEEPFNEVLDHRTAAESSAYLEAYRREYDEGIWTAEEFRDDNLVLTGALDETVNEVLDDSSLNESAAYLRIRRLKGSRGWKARDRREGHWIPPDLTGYGPPVFWPVGEPHAPGPAQVPAEPVAIDPSEITWEVVRQVLMTPLVTLPELARARGLDEDVVQAAVQALQKEGRLKSLSFGCLMPRTARFWVDLVHDDTTPWDDLERSVVTWHRDGGLGSLIQYDLPRVESVNAVASKYVLDGWELEGVAWLEQAAVQAVGLYNLKAAPHIKSVIYFVWVSRWDTEREVWERLSDLPEAVNPITQPSFPGSVVLVGDDRWAVAWALPMAVERLRASGVGPAHVAAWTYAEGWQAASGASMLDGADQPFTPALAPIQLDRFVWPRSRRSLGRTRLETIIAACPWTRRDSCTLYEFFIRMAEFPGGSTAHYAALRGKNAKDGSAWTSIRTLLELGLATEAGVAGVSNLPVSDKSRLLSERGQGRMRLRLSLSPKVEMMLADLARMLALGQAGESTEELRTKLGALAKLAELAVGEAADPLKGHTPPMANGAHRLMLTHGHLSYREIVRRSALARLPDRLGDRRFHDDILVDILGRFCLLGCEAVPTSRAITVNLDGHGIESDAVIYCSSPAGHGHHRLELELSHLGPKEIGARLEKYARQFISYPLLAVCGTDRGARHFDRIGQELGVPVVATSIPRLHEKGFSAPAWIHLGQEASVTPVSCPPGPANP